MFVTTTWVILMLLLSASLIFATPKKPTDLGIRIAAFIFINFFYVIYLISK